MSAFWRNILTMILPVIIKIIEQLLKLDIDGDGSIGE